MKIKILRIINRFNLGGPTYNATYLSAYLSDEFETLLVGGGHEDYEGSSTFIPDKLGLNYILVDELQREISFKRDRAAYNRIREIIREYKPDIVHTHASKAGFIGRLAASKEKVPVIVHTFHGHIFHSYFGAVKTSFFKILERRIAKKTSAIITISKLQNDELVNKFKIIPSKKARIIKLGFDLERFQKGREEKKMKFRTDFNFKSDEILVGIIGRLTAIKNHDLFIDAVQLISSKIESKVKFVIIGDGEEMERLSTKCSEIEAESGKKLFVFTSWIKEIDVALAGLDIVALSSLNEGTPVSLIEAQASGVPIVTTNVGGVKDVVIDDETAFVVENNNKEEFAEKLFDLISSEKIRKKMSQNGWSHVRDEFSYKRLCLETELLYKELLEKKG